MGSPLLGGTVTEEEVNNDEVLCVNPSVLVQGNYAGPMWTVRVDDSVPGLTSLHSSKRRKHRPRGCAYPVQYSGQCERANGATLAAAERRRAAPTTTREQIEEVLGPLWGTHLEDVNVALGNLVGVTLSAVGGLPVGSGLPPLDRSRS